MANIYRRGPTWWARVQRGGKEHRRSLKTRSESLARKRLGEWLAELEALAWGERPRLTLNEVANRFIFEHCPTLRPSSARRYDVSLVWLDQRLGTRFLDQIDRAALMDFETWRRSQGASAPTVRRDLACLSSILGFAVDNELIDSHPVRAFMRARGKKGLRESQSRTRYLSHDEERRLLAAASPHVREAIIFAIGTGLRRDEQFALTWDRLDVDAARIRLDGEATKGKRDRHVVMLPAAVKACRHKPRHIRSPYVWWNPESQEGERYEHLNKGLLGAARRAKIADLTWHDLRRTHGCRLLQDHGWSMEMVRDQLGHSSVKVTEKAYAFLEVEHRHDRVYPGTKAGTEPAD